jgi:hypothetical protein
MAKRGAEAEAEETGVENANDRDMQALQEAAKPPKREESEESEPLEFEEAGREEEDDGAETTQPERPSRKERRQNRFKEAMERAERAEQAAAAQAQRLAQLEQMVRGGGQQVPQQQGPSVQDYDNALSANQKEQLWLSKQYQIRLNQLQGQMAAEEEEDWLRRNGELKDREQALRIEKVAMANGYRPQQQQENPVVVMLRAEYHDVEGNPAAKAYAQAFYRSAVARGEAEGLPLLRKALDYGREWLGGDGQAPRPGGRAKPTAQTQSRFTGSAPGASPARGGGDSRQNTRVTLPDGLSMKDFKRMADKAFPHIKDDGKRYTHYYKTVVQKSQSQED